MNKETKIREYILQQYPNEACGVICGDEFFPITNVSDTPEIKFRLNEVELIQIQQTHTIDYIVHSHTYTTERKPLFDLDPRTPSHGDYINQQKHNVPWLIYATEGENVTPPITLDPSNTQRDLLGREFIFYVNDCYTLVRDFYHQKLGIYLEPHSTKWTWEEGATSNCYEEYFKDWNFEKVDISDLQYGDIIIMSILGDCNHAGVYIGDSTMIHHLTRRQSDTILVPKMMSFIQFVLRYKNET